MSSFFWCSFFLWRICQGGCDCAIVYHPWFGLVYTTCQLLWVLVGGKKDNILWYLPGILDHVSDEKDVEGEENEWEQNRRQHPSCLYVYDGRASFCAHQKRRMADKFLVGMMHEMKLLHQYQVWFFIRKPRWMIVHCMNRKLTYPNKAAGNIYHPNNDTSLLSIMVSVIAVYHLFMRS